MNSFTTWSRFIGDDEEGGGGRGMKLGHPASIFLAAAISEYGV